MKYFLRVLMLALALLLPLAALAGSGDGVVAFTDKVLDGKVRDALEEWGPITLSMAEAVTVLDLANSPDTPQEYKITRIDDLKVFKNLEVLNLNGNDVHDIGVVAGLTKLNALFLERNDVYDFSPLAGLVNLRDLYIEGHGKDLSFLGGLVNLDRLGLGGGNGALPEELKSLTKLTSFAARWGAVSDIGILAELRGLTSVDLIGNMITDVSPLSGLPLTRLFLSDNFILDYSPLKDLYPSLKEKDFQLILPDDEGGVRPADALVFNDAALEKKVRKAMGIPEGYVTKAQAEEVTALDLGNPQEGKALPGDMIEDLTALTQFPNLVSLNLDNNGFHEVRPLPLLKGLKELSLKGDDIWDLSPLSKLEGLQSLALDCRGKDLGFLAGLGELVYLDLGSQGQLPGELASLTKLVTLKAAGGDFSDISVLSGLTSLEVLDLSWNLVENLTPLKDLPLKELYLDGDPVADFSPIKALYGRLTGRDFTALFPDGVPDEELIFADKNFETALRQAMNIFGRPITQKDAYLVTKLDIYSDKVPGAQFEDISPLAYFVNLTELSFNGNNISDLSPLSKLTELTDLNVGYQRISDLSPLNGLGKLRHLHVRGNRIADVSPLAGLLSLTYLDAAQNQITDVKPLASLVNLTKLYLAENPVSDFTPLEKLAPRLEDKDFHVTGPATAPDEPIAFADKNFEKAVRKLLNIPKAPITRRDALEVTALDFTGAKIKTAFKDISPLRYFENLKTVSMTGNGISGLSVFAELKSLETLILDSQKISDLSPLAGLASLSRLSLNKNQISDLSPLWGLKGLHALALSGNRIADIAPLAGLEGLEELALSRQPGGGRRAPCRP